MMRFSSSDKFLPECRRRARSRLLWVTRTLLVLLHERPTVPARRSPRVWLAERHSAQVERLVARNSAPTRRDAVAKADEDLRRVGGARVTERS